MRERAFTLLELMVVMVIIAVAAAAILPEMRGTLEDMLLRSTAREIVSACHLASSQAITSGRPHRLRFNTAETQYALERSGNPETGEPAFVRVEDVPGASGEWDRRIQVNFRNLADDLNTPPARPASGGPASGEVITFYADGTAEAGEFQLKDREGFSLQLRINPTTSRVRILKEHRP